MYLCGSCSLIFQFFCSTAQLNIQLKILAELHGKVFYLFFRWIKAEVEWNGKGGLKREYGRIQIFIWIFFFLQKCPVCRLTLPGYTPTWASSSLGAGNTRGRASGAGELNKARRSRSFSRCAAPGRGRCFICKHGGRQQVQMSSCGRRSVKGYF